MSIERILWAYARPAPRGPLPVQGATRPLPLAGIRADDLPTRLPARKRAVASRTAFEHTDGSTRAWVDLQDLRSLYRCEDSAGWLVRRGLRSLLPV
ncbi:hypothetical protein BN2476_240084 [Paraburkholderia piptadeniae]|uniref:Uncharacterized protein n=1 Tax=Paraburkholderia piptadeniae TaxID=1701573 RepID=A0A1N7RZZ3_9BURK|nr:hypothetical protein BN2476_240084 [Paraburkholderia piptadeniae]